MKFKKAGTVAARKKRNINNQRTSLKLRRELIYLITIEYNFQFIQNLKAKPNFSQMCPGVLPLLTSGATQQSPQPTK